MKTPSLFLILSAAGASVASADLIWSSPLDGNADAIIGLSGTPGGAPLAVPDKNGNPNGAVSFDGIDDFYEILPAQTTFTAGSMSVWVNALNFTNSEAGPVSIGASGGGAAEYFTLHRSWRGDLDDGDDGVGAARLDVLSDVTAPTGTWQHVVLTFTALGELRMYVDGVLQGDVQSLATSEPDYTFTSNWVIGSERTTETNRFFAGSIDDVRIYNHELDQTEVDDLFNAGPAYGVVGDTDIDDDGLNDFFEDRYFGNNNGIVEPSDLTPQSGAGNADGDTLTNLEEQGAGTNPTVADSDGDGINDDEELVSGADGYITLPLVADTDGDGLLDGEETTGSRNTWSGGVAGGPPGDPTDPTQVDSDFDTLSDFEEATAGVDGFITDPNEFDTDGDGFDDGEESANRDRGFDPTADDSAGDYDDDGLTNGEELSEGTEALNPDTDGDGRSDGAEVNGPIFTDALFGDTDLDLASDGEEVDNATDPDDAAEFPRVANLEVDFSIDGAIDAYLVHELFYQPYLAFDRVNSLDSDPAGGADAGVDRLDEEFAATFYSTASTVRLSVSYPDLVDPVANFNAKRMLDRAGSVANYAGGKVELIRDWIGVDSRTASGGNGTLSPTTLRMSFAGLPAGDYLLRTYHHDLQNQSPLFDVVVTDADSVAEPLPGPFRQSSGDAQNRIRPAAGQDPAELRTTIEQVIRSNGSDPVVVDFSVTDQGEGRSIIAVNGFELEETIDSDGDNVADATEIAIFGGIGVSEFGPTEDQDSDGISDLAEVLRGLDPMSGDSDGDGLPDALETDTGISGGTAGEEVEITSFVYNADEGQVTLDWTPAVTADVRGSLDLTGFAIQVADDATPPLTQVLAGPLAGAPTAFFRIDTGGGGGFGTNPFVSDSDSDGVSDGDEVNVHGSNPNANNSDGDAFLDGHEVLGGSSPTDAASIPDIDGDGWSNATEAAAGTEAGDPGSTPAADSATELWVDFNSSQEGGGDSTGADPQTSVAAFNQSGYSSYHANHEVLAEFTTATYTAFGGSVTLTPLWPDTTAATVAQSIGRAQGNADTWNGDNRNLLRDWIGVDSRTASAGNGVYDGVSGTPTRIELVLGGLPAGTYDWVSFHHDVENMWTDFQVEVSTDGGTTYGPLSAELRMTDGTAGGEPASPQTYDGPLVPNSLHPADLPSTFTTTFTANGSDNVVVRFVPLTEAAVHRSFVGINGFQLKRRP